jgi:hypothetical protein
MQKSILNPPRSKIHRPRIVSMHECVSMYPYASNRSQQFLSVFFNTIVRVSKHHSSSSSPHQLKEVSDRLECLRLQEDGGDEAERTGCESGTKSNRVREVGRDLDSGCGGWTSGHGLVASLDLLGGC